MAPGRKSGGRDVNNGVANSEDERVIARGPDQDASRFSADASKVQRRPSAS